MIVSDMDAKSSFLEACDFVRFDGVVHSENMEYDGKRHGSFGRGKNYHE
jgi:hypothetical protein